MDVTITSSYHFMLVWFQAAILSQAEACEHLCFSRAVFTVIDQMFKLFIIPATQGFFLEI